MKIVLVVVVLVACLAAVNCQDPFCLSNGLRDNANLQECNTMLAVTSVFTTACMHSQQQIDKFVIYLTNFLDPCINACNYTIMYTWMQTAATNLEAFCQLPCINGLAALLTTCQLPNSITQCTSFYIYSSIKMFTGIQQVRMQSYNYSIASFPAELSLK